VTESVARSRLIQSGEPMCDRCEEIDHTIERYRRIAPINDDITVDRANELIADLESQKAVFHSMQTE
jgi:hypothetical protein